MDSLDLDEASLLNLSSVLVHSMSPSSADRMQAMDTLESLKTERDILSYLCFLLTKGHESSILRSQYDLNTLHNLCATAGILLKNFLPRSHIANYDLTYLKVTITDGLYSPINLVSNVTGIVITNLFSNYYRQHRNDPMGVETLSKLLQMASNGNSASMKAISKIMEDNAQFFQFPFAGVDNILDVLLTHFLQFMASHDTIIIAEAIKCMNCFIQMSVPSVDDKIDAFLENLINHATSNENNQIRQQICIAFTRLLSFRRDKLVVHLNGIVQFVLHLMETSDDDSLGLEACEFILAFCSDKNIPETSIRIYVKDIVPILLRKMVYDEESLLNLEVSNDDDADIEDKDEDIKPVSSNINRKHSGNSDGDTDDGDDDSNVDHNWNLRKCASASLDMLTNLFPVDVTEIAFPIITEHLTSENWYSREACVLALGAIAEGGMKCFDRHIPALIPFLVEQLKDTWAPVRTITCWTLSRFSTWILEDHTEFLLPVLEPILEVLLDKKKAVQESAITAVAVFIENCDAELVEMLLYNKLLNSFNQCFHLYKKKNLIILYDAISRLAEKVEMDEVALQSLFPHMINKWTSLRDTDKELWPLMECLSYCAVSLGDKFTPMAPEVYDRTFRILCRCVDLELKSQTDPSIDVPEKDFVITSLDLIDGILQALGGKALMLFFPDENMTFFTLLKHCLVDPTHDVRQSSYALIGDMSVTFNQEVMSPLLATTLKSIVQDIMYNDDPEATSCVNNAVWSLGLIAERNDIREYIIDIVRAVLDLFTSTNTSQKYVLENLAVTIGRLAIFHAEQLALEPFTSEELLRKWCTIAKDLQDTEEKVSCYGGFLKILKLMDSSKNLSSRALYQFICGLSKGIPHDTLISWQQDLYVIFLRHQAELDVVIPGLKESEYEVLSFCTSL
ncbi:HBR187Cp [Eremothecium sinecaudum]|uniref:HBR187Cp n=1 Tax=Eremothecium sinecaudum TaxID=45286 RepID=A0A109UX42_9SACH|nr:HBR187Cp [Eremothecium sinecaudum]AMD19088.1 HBR187Cp [Eremothecium sinecaudum]